LGATSPTNSSSARPTEPEAGRVLLETLPVLASAIPLLIKLLLANRWFDPWPVQSVAIRATVGAVLVFHVPLMLWASRWRNAMAVALNLGLTTLIVADLTYYSFFRDVLSVNQLTNAWMLPSIWESIEARLLPWWALLYLDILVTCIVLIRRRPSANATSAVRWRIASSGVLLVAGLALVWPTRALMQEDPDNVFGWRAARTQFVAAIGLVPYHLFDLGVDASSWWARSQVTEADAGEVQRVLGRVHAANASRSSLFGAAQDKNLIIIQAESLQAFTIGLTSQGEPVTPNLNAFAAESLVFSNFHDQTFGGATSDSMFVSLQSLYALGPGQGAVATRYANTPYHGLPAVLASEGYATLAAMGSESKYWLIGDLLKRLGFTRSYFDNAYPTQERFGQGIPDHLFFHETASILGREREPFFAFLVSVSNHHPYDLPPKLRALPLGPLEGTLLGHYLDSVHYFDRAFGEFITELRRSGLLKRTVVVVYGDHQGWLDDTPELAQLAGFDPGDRFQYWRLRRRLPLFIRLPDAANAGTISVLSGHADTAPTLLSLLGIPRDPVMLGTDLTTGTPPLVVFRNGSLAADGKYLINDPKLGMLPSCFDVATAAEVSCASLDARKREALERIEASDLIIRGGLVPRIEAARAR
jgi:phosphoglycerol transferase MdoB-like AlkP superfamily enzyme